MKPAQNFKFLTECGIKATPIPGTNKYFIEFQDGSSVYVNERAFFNLLNSGESTENIIRLLREQNLPRNHPERYQKLFSTKKP
ncbi:hypothetical protein [Desulfofundulus sp.]|uniref:hypothetical protein n=1 Tax=Desulfofundulus sp. TaxID=2282750 RepID=UPI003C73924E